MYLQRWAWHVRLIRNVGRSKTVIWVAVTVVVLGFIYKEVNRTSAERIKQLQSSIAKIPPSTLFTDTLAGSSLPHLSCASQQVLLAAQQHRQPSVKLSRSILPLSTVSNVKNLLSSLVLHKHHSYALCCCVGRNRIRAKHVVLIVSGRLQACDTFWTVTKSPSQRVKSLIFSHFGLPFLSSSLIHLLMVIVALCFLKTWGVRWLAWPETKECNKRLQNHKHSEEWVRMNYI